MMSGMFGTRHYAPPGLWGIVSCFFTGLHPVLTDQTPSGLVIMVNELALQGQNPITMGVAHRTKYGKNNISPEGV